MGTHQTLGLSHHIISYLMILCAASPLNFISVNMCVSWNIICPYYFPPFMKIHLQKIKGNQIHMDAWVHITYWGYPITSSGL